MKYIRTKDGRIIDRTNFTCFKTNGNKGLFVNDNIVKDDNLEKWLKYNNTSIFKQADTIEELCDEFVFVEKGNISIVSCLAEAKDRLLEYRDFDNYEPRLIGRIKVGLDVKAVAEFKELTEGKYKGCYDWVLL